MNEQLTAQGIRLREFRWEDIPAHGGHPQSRSTG